MTLIFKHNEYIPFCLKEYIFFVETSIIKTGIEIYYREIIETVEDFLEKLRKVK